MSEMTRRTLLRDGSLAATAATLLPAGLTNAAEAEVAEAAIFQPGAHITDGRIEYIFKIL